MSVKQQSILTLSSKLIYVVKCSAGVAVCYYLYKQIPAYPFYWAIVSVVLALSPDNSNEQAFNRIKANTIGCAVGLIFYPINLPEIAIICLGLTVTVIIGFAINNDNTLRVSQAAFIITILQEDTHRHWYIALERVICVSAGCIIALLLTIMVNIFSGILIDGFANYKKSFF